jgi:hypothetical protein
MPRFSFELEIPPGIVSDDTTFASKGRWADCDGIRFREGKPETLPGYVGLAAGFANNLLSIGIAAGKIIVGSDSGLFALTNSGASTNISPGPLGGPTSSWSITNWGDLVIASPSGLKIYESTGALAATRVTNSPASNTRVLVTPQRQILAFGTNEVSSGTFNGRCIRGCDLENRTVWTPASTNNSFEDILDDPGTIVGAELIGSYVAVWTTTSLFLGQFVGDPSQTYRWDRVDSTGLISAAAVTVLHGTAYWLGSDLNLYAWQPGGVVEQLKCPIWRDFGLNYRAGSTFGSGPLMYGNTRYNEVWLHYCDTRDGVSNSTTRYIAVCLDDMSWFRGLRRISAAHSSAAASAILDATYDPGAYFTTTFGGVLYVEGTGSSGDDSYLQSADQYIDAGRTRVMVQSVQPDFEQQTGAVALTAYVRDRPQSSAVTKGPYTLTNTVGKTDFRASGKLMALKFSAAAGVKWRLGKPTFDCATMGER